MVPPACDARLVGLIPVVFKEQVRPAPGTGLESPETGSQNRRDRALSCRQRPQAPRLNRENARKLRAFRQRPGNVGSHWNAWWARECRNAISSMRLVTRPFLQIY